MDEGSSSDEEWATPPTSPGQIPTSPTKDSSARGHKHFARCCSCHHGSPCQGADLACGNVVPSKMQTPNTTSTQTTSTPDLAAVSSPACSNSPTVREPNPLTKQGIRPIESVSKTIMSRFNKRAYRHGHQTLEFFDQQPSVNQESCGENGAASATNTQTTTHGHPAPCTVPDRPQSGHCAHCIASHSASCSAPTHIAGRSSMAADTRAAFGRSEKSGKGKGKEKVTAKKTPIKLSDLYHGLVPRLDNTTADQESTEPEPLIPICPWEVFNLCGASFRQQAAESTILHLAKKLDQAVIEDKTDVPKRLPFVNEDQLADMINRSKISTDWIPLSDELDASAIAQFEATSGSNTSASADEAEESSNTNEKAKKSAGSARDNAKRDERHQEALSKSTSTRWAKWLVQENHRMRAEWISKQEAKDRDMQPEGAVPPETDEDFRRIYEQLRADDDAKFLVNQMVAARLTSTAASLQQAATEEGASQGKEVSVQPTTECNDATRSQTVSNEKDGKATEELAVDTATSEATDIAIATVTPSLPTQEEEKPAELTKNQKRAKARKEKKKKRKEKLETSTTVGEAGATSDPPVSADEPTITPDFLVRTDKVVKEAVGTTQASGEEALPVHAGPSTGTVTVTRDGRTYRVPGGVRVDMTAAIKLAKEGRLHVEMCPPLGKGDAKRLLKATRHFRRGLDQYHVGTDPLAVIKFLIDIDMKPSDYEKVHDLEDFLTLMKNVEDHINGAVAPFRPVTYPRCPTTRKREHIMPWAASLTLPQLKSLPPTIGFVALGGLVFHAHNFLMSAASYLSAHFFNRLVAPTANVLVATDLPVGRYHFARSLLFTKTMGWEYQRYKAAEERNPDGAIPDYVVEKMGELNQKYKKIPELVAKAREALCQEYAAELEGTELEARLKEGMSLVEVAALAKEAMDGGGMVELIEKKAEGLARFLLRWPTLDGVVMGEEAEYVGPA